MSLRPLRRAGYAPFHGGGQTTFLFCEKEKPYGFPKKKKPIGIVPPPITAVLSDDSRSPSFRCRCFCAVSMALRHLPGGWCRNERGSSRPMGMLALLQAEGERQRSVDASSVPARTAEIEDGSLTMGLFSLEIQKAFLFGKRKVVWPLPAGGQALCRPQAAPPVPCGGKSDYPSRVIPSAPRMASSRWRIWAFMGPSSIWS